MGKKGKVRQADRWAIALTSLGVSGWALIVELLFDLQERGYVSDPQAKKMIVGARNTIGEMHEVAPHPALEIALITLDRHLKEWPRRRKPKG